MLIIFVLRRWRILSNLHKRAYTRRNFVENCRERSSLLLDSRSDGLRVVTLSPKVNNLVYEMIAAREVGRRNCRSENSYRGNEHPPARFDGAMLYKTTTDLVHL
jgi:hypothetical protein